MDILVSERLREHSSLQQLNEAASKWAEEKKQIQSEAFNLISPYVAQNEEVVLKLEGHLIKGKQKIFDLLSVFGHVSNENI